MDRMACTEVKCLYKGALYLYLLQLVPGNQDAHWNTKKHFRFLESCWSAFLHTGSIVEVAYEFVGNLLCSRS